MGIGGGAAGLLIVGRQVLDAGSLAGVLLHASGNGSSKNAGEIGVLRVVFKVSAAQGIALDVQARRQPEVDPQLLHFGSGNIPGQLGQLWIPALGQLHRHRQCRAILIFDLRTA